MRSPELFVEEYGNRSGHRLFSIYLLTFAWYVFGVIVASTLGIEPLYSQVPPFYANALPASSIPGVATGTVLAALLLYAGLRIVAGVPIRRVIRFGLLVFAVLILFATLLLGSVIRQGINLRDFWDDFRWNLPLLTVVTTAAVIIVRLTRRVRWWDDELPNKTAWRVAIALTMFSFALAGSVAMIRGGTAGIAAAYGRTHYEYVDDIGKGVTLLGFLAKYNDMHALLSMHAKVHPPGPVVMLWIMSSFLLSRDALVLSLGTMAAGSLAVPPLFVWVRDMLGQRVALTCCALYTMIPSIVIFTATSADILFMPLLLLTLLLFWRAIHRGSVAYALGAGATYALMSLCSFSLLTVGAYFAFTGLLKMTEPARRAPVVKTAALMLVSFLAIHLAVRLLTGFDIIECFRLSHRQFLEDQVNLDSTLPRYPSWTFKFFNPVCWFFYAGIPVSLLFVWRQLKPAAETKRLFLVFLVTLFVIAPLYLARGEGERSAMYVFPFIVIPAAHLLDQLGLTARSFRPMAMTFVFLLIQSWLIETYLYTFW